MTRLFVNGRLTDKGGADRWLWGVLRRLSGPRRLLVGSIDRQAPAEVLEAAGVVERVKELDRSGLAGPPGPGLRAALDRALAAAGAEVIISNDVVDPAVLHALADAGEWWAMVQDHRAFCPGQGKWHAEGRVCDRVMGLDCVACTPDPAYGPRIQALTEGRCEALARATGITVLSHYMRQELIAVGLPAERIVVVPPFVDAPPPLPRCGPGDWHLLAGRLTVHKGVGVALQAQAGLGLPLRVAGAGPMAADCAAAGLSAAWADREGLGRLLLGARSLWLPSLWAEPFGIIGLEALAAGVPVIGSAVGGVGDWLDETVGIVIPPGDPVALHAAARALEADPARAVALGEAGRARVAQDFDPARIVAVLDGLWRPQAESRKAPTG